jgi:hypothetical protein
MVLIGFPIGDRVQAEIPARIVINPYPFGTSDFNVDPGTRINYKATVYDEKGNVVSPGSKTCGGIIFEVINPVFGKVIELLPAKNGNATATIVFDRARGPAQVVASCKKNPDLKGRQLVSGTGGKGKFEPTEIEPTEIKPTEIKPTEIRSWLESPETAALTPAERAPGEKAPTPEAGPDIGPAALLIGVAAAAAIAAGGLGGEKEDNCSYYHSQFRCHDRGYAGGLVPAKCNCPSGTTYAGMDNTSRGGPWKICMCK